MCHSTDFVQPRPAAARRPAGTCLCTVPYHKFVFWELGVLGDQLLVDGGHLQGPAENHTAENLWLLRSLWLLSLPRGVDGGCDAGYTNYDDSSW